MFICFISCLGWSGQQPVPPGYTPQSSTTYCKSSRILQFTYMYVFFFLEHDEILIYSTVCVCLNTFLSIIRVSYVWYTHVYDTCMIRVSDMHIRYSYDTHIIHVRYAYIKNKPVFTSSVLFVSKTTCML